MKTSITILGSCVTNQMIRCGANIGVTPFLVKGAISLVNIMTIATKPIPELENLVSQFPPENDMRNLSRSLAVNKNIEKVCRGKILLIDFGTLRNPIYEFVSVEGEKYYLSERPICDINKNNKKLIMEFANKNGYSIKKVENPLLQYSVEKQNKLLDILYDRIISKYCEDNIIFAQTRYGNERIRQDGTLDLNGFNSRQNEKENLAIERCEDYFCNKGNFKVIKVLPYIVTDDDESLHPNGSPLHYNHICYEYGIRMLDIMTDDQDQNTLLERSRNLYSEYIKKIMDVRENAIIKSLNMLKKMKDTESYAYSWNNYCNQTSMKDDYLDIINKRYMLKNQKLDKKILLCKTIDEYITAALKSEEKYIIFIAVKDTADTYWKNWQSRERLGIKTDLSKNRRQSYCAMINTLNGNIIEQYDKSDNEMHFNYELRLKNRYIYTDSETANENYYCVYLSSKAKRGESQEMWASIMINNIDYAINKRGMNFVVFSLDRQCVVDSFYVNFVTDKKLTIRRK